MTPTISLSGTRSEADWRISSLPYPERTPSSSSIAAPALRSTEQGRDHARVGANRIRRPLRDLLAVIHHHDLVAEPHHEGHVVLDDQQRPAPGAQIVERVGDLAANHRVHAGERLVEQEERR